MPLARNARRPVAALAGACAVTLALVATLGGPSRSSAEQGQYLHFGGPGAGLLRVADAPSLSPASEITIEAWVYVTSGNAWPAGDCPSLVGKGRTSSYWLGLECGGSTALYFFPGDGNSAVSAGSLPTGEWVHVAVTYDGAEVKFYINGILDSTVALIGALGSNNEPLYIGLDIDWVRSPIGHIDEVHVWSIVRSQQSVLADMDPITTPQIGLVGVWNMEGTPDADVGGFTGELIGDVEFAGTPITPSPSPEPPFKKGDIDCDHAITPHDALPPLKFLSSSGPPPVRCEEPLLFSSQGVLDTWWDASPGFGYIEIPHADALNPADEISIELWVNLWSYNSPNSLVTCQSLVGKGYQTAYWLGICSGHLRFYSRGNSSLLDSVGLVPLRQWVHIAVTADAATTRFFVNGQLQHESSDQAGPLTANAQPLRIGSDVNWNIRPWAALDDVRIWNVALTPEEIQGLMSNPPVYPASGLVAEYSLDGDAQDSTGSHNGADVGAVSYGTGLPSPHWHDINCSGLLDKMDALALLAHLAAVPEAAPLPEGCEPVGTPTG
jgi:hypothetical protein